MPKHLISSLSTQPGLGRPIWYYMSNMNIIENDGKTYISGDTYPIRGELKAAGCRWDPGTKSWWIATAQADKAKAVLGQVAEAEAAQKARAIAQEPELAANAGCAIVQPRETAGLDCYGKTSEIGIVLPGYGGKFWMVISTGRAYYHSEDFCEDIDCFCGDYGWHTPVECVRVTEPEDVKAERLANEAEAEAKAQAEAKAEADYAAAKAAIPADYKEVYSGEALGEARWELKWETLATKKGFGDFTFSLATLPDGRPIYRENYYSYDDDRDIWFLPADLVPQTTPEK